MTEEEYLAQFYASNDVPDNDECYGDEDQNTLMQLIKQYKGDYGMDKEFVGKVTALVNEIEGYEQVISDANDAKDFAERELSEVLTDHESAVQE